MKNQSQKLIILAILATGLSACYTMTPNTERRAKCNMLKSQLVFNGATSNDREAYIQQSGEQLQAANYDKDCQGS